MKSSITISILAIILSIVSLVRSYKAPAPVGQEQVREAAREALREREKEFVDEIKPRFQTMFSETGSEYDKGWEPTTIEELIEPLTKMVNEMSEQ